MWSAAWHQKLALTVTSLLPDGGMNIYGTAVFNGNIEDINWSKTPVLWSIPVQVSLLFRLCHISASQIHQTDRLSRRRPLNVQRAPQNLKPSMPPANTQNQASNATPNVARQPVEKPFPSSKTRFRNEHKPAPEQQAESLKENALDNANEANQASYSFEARQIINHAAGAIGLQSTYGMPEYSVIAGDKKTNIYIIFNVVQCRCLGCIFWPDGMRTTRAGLYFKGFWNTLSGRNRLLRHAGRPAL